MYELIQAGARTYYVNMPAKAGLYADADGRAVLIDSGGDRDAAKKIDRHLKEHSWTLTVIVNTHSHADHCGGNAFFAERYGCKILSPGVEGAFVRYPVLEPSFLYGGCPPRALRNKFLQAQPSVPADGSLPEGFGLVPLPGHSFDMTGVRTPDGVLFLADCLSGANILEKYHINFIYDVEQYLATLSAVERMRAALFVPAHAEPTENIRPLVQRNRAKAEEIIALLLELCRAPVTQEELQKRVFVHYGLKLDFNQYVLVGSTLRSYLSYLLDRNLMETLFEENRLLWKTL